MKRLTCIDYRDSATCRTLLYQSKESFLTCSFELNAGNAHGVVSDSGDDGRSLARREHV